jgi:hypothetical protein
MLRRLPEAQREKLAHSALLLIEQAGTVHARVHAPTHARRAPKKLDVTKMSLKDIAKAQHQTAGKAPERDVTKMSLNELVKLAKT